MTTDQTPQPTQRTVAGADGPPPSKAADQPKPRTAVTHASGPRKDQPVAQAKHPATVAELMTKLGTPDVPTAYGQAHQLSGRVWELAGDMEPDDPDALRGSLLEKATALLSEGADGVFQREQWTAALRHVAPLAGADPQTAPRTVLLALAQEIEDGTITPWDAVRASGPRAGQPVEPADLGQPVAVLEVAVLEDQLCRRVWAAALRWEAGQMHPGRLEGAGERGYFAACLEIDAERIETGDLTPWADQPEPAGGPDHDGLTGAPHDRPTPRVVGRLDPAEADGGWPFGPAEPARDTPAATTPTDGLDLDAIQARADAASDGPWRAHDTHLDLDVGGYTATVLRGGLPATHLVAWLPTMSHEPWDDARNCWADSEFIAAARSDVPALVAEVRRLRSAVAVRDDWQQYGSRIWDPAVIQGLLDNLDGVGDPDRRPEDRCRSATGDHLRAVLEDLRQLRVDQVAAATTPAPGVAGGSPAILGRARKLIRERLAADPDIGHQHAFADLLADVAARAVAPLLPSPSAGEQRGRVVEEARELVAAWRRGDHTVDGLAIAAAVDALDGDHPAEPARQPTANLATASHGLAAPEPAVKPSWAGSCLCEDREAHDPDCRQGHGPDCGADCWGAFGCPRRHDHSAEPAGAICTRCGQPIDPSLTAVYGGPEAPRHGTCPAEPAPERCTALTRHTDINGDDMVPCDNPLPCPWHLGELPTPSAEDEAEMDAAIAEFAALPDCQQCAGSGKQVPDGWYERRREGEQRAAQLLAPAVGAWHRDRALREALQEDAEMDAIQRDEGDAEPAPEVDAGPVSPVDLAAVTHAAGGGFRSQGVDPELAPEPDSGSVIPEIMRGRIHAAEAELERQRQRADTATGKVLEEHLAWQQMLDRAEAAEARLEEAERDRDRYRATLPAEVQDYWHWRGVAERLERELATARRDAAADFGTWLAGRVIGYLVDGQRYHPGNVQIVMEANDER